MFFQVHMPQYASDAEEEARNCCLPDPGERFRIPGIVCPYCGTTWGRAGSYLLTDVALSASLRKKLSRSGPVPFDEYEDILEMVRQELQLAPSTWIIPGTRIGRLILKCECAGRVEDFMWIQGRSGLQVVVPQRVLDVLKGAGLAGYEAYRVRVTNAGELPFELPPLHELLVTGRGGPMGPEAGRHLLSVCSRCGRRQYERHGPGGDTFDGLYVNPETWDGSDFFTFDDLPSIFMITEKARSVMADAGLSNWQAYPAPLGIFKWGT